MLQVEPGSTDSTSDKGFRMTSGASIQFWQPVPDAATELVCACVAGRDAPPHLHEEWQFGVLEAPSHLSLGAYRRYTVHAGQVTIVHPYAVHSEGGELGALPNWRMLYLAPSMMNRLYGGVAHRVSGAIVNDPAAASELRELLRHSSDGAIGGAEFLSRLACWLQEFLRCHAEPVAATQRIQAIERARAYLQDRPSRPVTLSEMGEIAGLSVSHFVRSFSREVGLPPRSYHAQVRLARARTLLAEGKPATWVAYECGFADQSHLSRRFKECHGVAPGAFQAQCLAQRSSAGMVESTAA
jgi:AraC-like DNA-binding protein